MTLTRIIHGEMSVSMDTPLTDEQVAYLSQDGWRLVRISEDRRTALFQLLNP